MESSWRKDRVRLCPHCQSCNNRQRCCNPYYANAYLGSMQFPTRLIVLWFPPWWRWSEGGWACWGISNIYSNPFHSNRIWSYRKWLHPHSPSGISEKYSVSTANPYRRWSPSWVPLWWTQLRKRTIPLRGAASPKLLYSSWMGRGKIWWHRAPACFRENMR